MTDNKKAWEDRFDSTFLNDNPLDSSRQFKREVEGKLPRLLKDFIEKEIKESKDKVIEDILRRLDVSQHNCICPPYIQETGGGGCINCGANYITQKNQALAEYIGEKYLNQK